MSDVFGQIIPGQLPTNCYPSDPQTLNNMMAAVNSVLFPGLTGIIISDVVPGPSDLDKAWLKTIGGAPQGIIYTFFNSQWVAKHLLEPSGIDRRWVTDISSLSIYDGGDTNPPGLASGPMWEEDTDFQGRSPMHPGNISGSDPLKNLAPLENYGEGSHILTVAELPANIPLQATLDGHRTNLEAGNPPQWLAPTASGGTLVTAPATEVASFPFTNTNGGVAHQTTHPVRGLYAIKRTGRVYYRGA